MLKDHDKNRRAYPVPFLTLSKSISSVDRVKTIKDGWESEDPPVETQAIKDDGKTIFPREDEQSVAPTKKLHDFTLSEDPETDENSWGGLAAVLAQIGDVDDREIDIENDPTIIKYGPGNYPVEAEFHYDLLAEKKLKFTWIIPNILAIGPYPTDVSELKKASFKAIVSVCDKPLDQEDIRGIHYYFARASKGSIDQLPTICKFIDRQETLGNPVYIHSDDSSGRAPAAVAAYLAHVEFLTAKESIGYVRQYYSNSAITPTQESLILQFAN